LRAFIAAARRLRRAQSAMGDLVSTLEAQIGIQLFDRTVRYPKRTAAGALPVADARSVVANVAVRKVRATGIFKGLEPELSAVIDVLYPIEAIAEAALKFREQSPHTPLRLYVEALNGAYQPVIDGRCSFGVVGSLPNAPDLMSVEPLPAVDMIMVAARNHPLAHLSVVISKAEFAKHAPNSPAVANLA